MKKNPYKRLAKFAIIPVLAAILFLPIKVPYRITITGEIRPLRAWMLTRGEGGQLQTRCFNFQKGTADGFSVIQFQRGEDMRFSLHPLLSEKSEIDQNDTVGTIYSSEFERDVTRIRGQLEVAREELKLVPNQPGGGRARLIQAKIDALEKELGVLLRRKQSFTVLAPFRSTIVRLAAPAETLLLLHDANAHVVLMPIPGEHVPDLVDIRKLQCMVNKHQITIDATDFSVGLNRTHLAGREVVIARALIGKQSYEIPSGMLVRCSIDCQPVTLFEYVRRFIERMVI